MVLSPYRSWYGRLQTIGLDGCASAPLQIPRIPTPTASNIYLRSARANPDLAPFHGDSADNSYGSCDIYRNEPVFGNETELTSARIGTCVG